MKPGKQRVMPAFRVSQFGRVFQKGQKVLSCLSELAGAQQQVCLSRLMLSGIEGTLPMLLGVSAEPSSPLKFARSIPPCRSDYGPDGDRDQPRIADKLSENADHSHSIVPGGLLV